MAQATNLNIVVLGGSFAGISAVHNIMKHVMPEVTESKKFSYRVVVISPSSHLYWNISAPRALVSTNLISHEESFQPISKAFAEYSSDVFEYVKGTVVALDTISRTVKISRPSENGSTRVSAVQDSTTIVDKVGSAINAAVNTVLGPGQTGSAPTPMEQHHQHQEEEEFFLPYHALIIATGSTAHSPLLSLRGPHTNTLSTIDEFQKLLPTSKTIVIAGGGPSGVEAAGQISYWFNQPYGTMTKPGGLQMPAPSLFSCFSRRSRLGPHAKEVILLCSSDRLLPNLDHVLGLRALRQLTGLGVRVILDIRVESASVAGSTNKTTLRLSNGSTMVCDQYVPCTGVTANTQFLPADSPLLKNGSIATTPAPSTLRVVVPPELMPPSILQEEPKAKTDGEAQKQEAENGTENRARVYAIGDCAAYSAKCILDIYAPMPVLMHNLVNDLTAYQLHYENPYGGNHDKIEDLQRQDMDYIKDERDSQIVPIGYRKPGGVGVVYGVKIPSLMVWLVKGKGYKVSAAKGVIEKGLSPY